MTMLSGMLASAVLSANAAITIVGHDSGIVPINQLEGQQLDVDANTHKQYDRNAIKKDLFNRYGNVENMLLYSDKFSEQQKSVLRELTMQLIQNQNKQIASHKHKVKIDTLKDQIEQEDEVDAVINDPDRIVEKRRKSAEVEAAKKKLIYKPQIAIDTEHFDPNQASQIELNNRVNRPSVISFFDTTGHPYTITSYFPTDAQTFELVQKGANQLLVSAKEEFEMLSGFVFLENEPQPIPFLLTSDPKHPIDVKRNVILPSVAPSNEAKVEQSVVPLSKLNKGDDPIMYEILHGLPTSAKALKQSGLSSDSRVYQSGEFTYIRTRALMKYEIDSAINIRGLYVYRARSRSSYWFNVNNREQKVSIYE
ncbi:DotH/IcmK family type IV secretion protein [Vibrio agarivorans]|uniref:DotH/IcmK family type IV secretion protein n=1 Tax=Vibrio agarivorans TaxID=153622 RepID=UPI0025B5F74C|nr:DotH/IcmK family type IV secretion protein [Vibrio agarivorans]MDN3661066.1 DotH/IcmK family type IV secretion protein [Vibrio agarivorans]